MSMFSSYELYVMELEAVLGLGRNLKLVKAMLECMVGGFSAMLW